MKKIGIWIDKRKAKIISIEDREEHLHTIASGIEDFHVKGGSGTKFKGGPQDVVQDRKYLEREKHQLTAFFKAIASYITGAGAIVIFGPAQTGEKLCKEFLEKYPSLHRKLKGLEKADSMNDNQLVAWVRDYYTSHRQVYGE